MCGGSYATISIFLTHLRMFHANEPGFLIQCGLQDCCRTFKNFHTFRNHIYSMHDLSSLSCNQSIEEIENVTLSGEGNDATEEDPEAEDGISPPEILSPSTQLISG